MRKLGLEIFQELKTVLSGKILDAVLPALLFVILNGQFGLSVAVIGAGIAAFSFGVMRILRKQSFAYAFGGLVSVILAGSMALIADNATNYFLPGIISNAFILVLAIGSLLIDKPMAAYASHISRGWKIDWFWLKSIKPAYREVTWIWTAFFLMRTLIQLTLYSRNDVSQLGWANTLMGLPITIIVLVLSYIYGIWRLKTLQGPGIDEYMAKKEAPYRGQNRGF
ncbi:MAG: hypothetical protein FD133_1303 [Erysipelotrichaceae bacterium]|nr:MAG: hypothetical protein FD179_205 [Erysipelotrichaceae bacterium]TXT17670.1 MAG: hypothetical protein FD133_1303 [Erysipelotrichaceae bacterium]